MDQLLAGQQEHDNKLDALRAEFTAFQIQNAKQISSITTRVAIYGAIAGSLGGALIGAVITYFFKHL